MTEEQDSDALQEIRDDIRLASNQKKELDKLSKDLNLCFDQIKKYSERAKEIIEKMKGVIGPA